MGRFLESITEPRFAWHAVVVWLLIKSTALLASVWLMHFCMSRMNPRWRILLWRSTAVALVILCSLAVCPPLINLRVLPASVTVHSDDVAISEPSTPSLGTGSGAEQVTVEQTALKRQHPAVDGSSAVTGVMPSMSGHERPAPVNSKQSLVALSQSQTEPLVQRAAGNSRYVPGSLRSWSTLMVAVWLGGFCLAVASSVVGWWRLRSIRNTSTEVTAAIAALAAKISTTLEVTQKFRVRLTSQLQSPCLIGIRRPLILVPEYRDVAPQEEEMPSILAHELAHLKGGDLYWNGLLQFLSMVFWFHPLMWRVRISHVDACDAVCDAVAANYVGSAAIYSRTLARLTLRLSRNRMAVGLAMARNSAICRRLEALQQCVSLQCLPGRRATCCCVLSLIAAIVIGGTTASRSLAEPPKVGAPTAPKTTIQHEPVIQPASKPNPVAEKRLMGIVKLSDGAPARNARVALSTAKNRAELNNGEFISQRYKAVVVSTDKEGRFHLPIESAEGSFVVVAVHSSGIAAVTKTDFNKSAEITLQPWGRIHGKVLIGTLPVPHCDLVVHGMHRLPQHYKEWNPHLYSLPLCQCDTQADANGEFVVNHLLPGDFQVSRKIFMPSPSGGGGRAYYCWNTSGSVASDKTLEVQIGGTGRPVIGRLVPDSRNNATIDWRQASEPVILEKWDLAKGHRSHDYVRYAAVIDPSGNFRIPDVPAGDYKFTTAIPIGNPVQNVQRKFTPSADIEFQITIPEISGGSSDEPFDLEDIESFVSRPLEIGESAPAFRITRIGDGLLNLSDYRGKLVLLDFWSPTKLDSAEQMRQRRQIFEQFKSEPRFSLLGIACDDDPELAKHFSQTNGFAWPQGHVRGTRSRVAREYAAGNLSTSYLIGPDGLVLAKNLSAEELQAIIAATVKGEALDANDKKPRRFPILRYPTTADSPSNQDVPAVVVGEDIDPLFATDQPRHDRLRLLSLSGATIWERSGLNLAQSAGGVHKVVVDRPRNRIYITEDATHRVIAYDLQGHRQWHLEHVKARAMAIDEQTGNLWCCCAPNLLEGETVVFDPQGTELATHPDSGVDIAYDRHMDAFWLVGKYVTKLDRTGKKLFHKHWASWVCASVSVNPGDGQVWVAERGHSDDTKSKNRLWLLNSDGTVRREWDFGEAYLYSVACVPKTGDAWISFVGTGGVRRVSPEGEMGELLPMRVTQLSISPTTGAIWTATEEAIFKLDADGKVLMRLPFAKPTSGCWLQAL